LTYIPAAKAKKEIAPKKDKDKKEKSTVPAGSSQQKEVKGDKVKAEKPAATPPPVVEEKTKNHGVEDSLIADAALAQLCVHHTDPQLAEFFVR
jgi:hypothetical protein